MFTLKFFCPTERNYYSAEESERCNEKLGRHHCGESRGMCQTSGVGCGQLDCGKRIYDYFYTQAYSYSDTKSYGSF